MKPLEFLNGKVGSGRSYRLKTLVSILCLVGLMATTFLLPPAASAVLPRLKAVSAASDPIIAAAGDIACDPTSSSFNNGNGSSSSCRQKYTSDILVNLQTNANLAAVLDLGDNQYYCGGYSAFLQSYDLSWGRVKSITHPSVGNHEYLTSGGTDCNVNNAGAAGYFEYFGAAAGSPGQGYYSFDIGSWHIIALNTNCSDAGGCSATSPQGLWLEADLNAHTNYCTLAFWHIPLFSSGGRASTNSKAFWQKLYNHNADLILDGHDHIYERFAPQDPNGVYDPVRGIREFTIGTGGANHTTITTVAANSEVLNSDTFGVLQLTLHAGSYDWQFMPESGKTFTDSGTTNCHGDAATATATATPTAAAGATPTAAPAGPTATATTPPSPTATIIPQTGLLFSDGFETGTLANWSAVQGLVVQSQQVASGNFAARGTSSPATTRGTYARKNIGSQQTNLYYRIRFNVLSMAANTVNLMKLRTTSDSPIWSVSINNLGQLSYRNDVKGTSINSTQPVSPGSWQSLEVHLKVAGALSQTEVWLNGALVGALSQTEDFGSNPVGRVQLGENTGGLTYDIAFDDVVVATSFIAP